MSEFIDDTAAHYPSVPLIMFRQRPMFKFGRTYQQGYVMFTAAKAHFAVHSVEFDLIEAMQGACRRRASARAASRSGSPTRRPSRSCTTTWRR